MKGQFGSVLYPGQMAKTAAGRVYPNAHRPTAQTNAASFEQHLQKSIQPNVTFSAHAADRIKQRNISLSGTDMEKITEAMDLVAAKGGRNALIMYKNTAFVVNVPNRTVVTAVDEQSLTSNVFTQIDSAMIL
ncbi:MAG: hypothetical protein JWN30_1541 [Bacilli bacterium]|nr:hypothetical protein [Bacilli bacterium]